MSLSWLILAPALVSSKPNILHIIVDDLRPEMNVAYHQPFLHTPNFDRLANSGLVFDRAYCQIAVCAPSRNSILSGLRPDLTAIFNFKNHIREPGQPKITTLPQYFKEHNYTVLGGGKTFHYNLPPYFDDRGNSGSWSSEIQPYYSFNEIEGARDLEECPNKVPNAVLS
jgi:iduronate 2-sulfatase